MARPKLGEILVKMKYLTATQLEGVVSHQKQWGVSLGRAAVAKGFCTQPQILEALSKQLNLPVVDLDKEELSGLYAPLIPQKFAEQHHVVPIRAEGTRAETLVVAMAAPATLASQDATLAIAKKQRLQVFLASDEAVHRAIGRLYRGEHVSFNVDEMVVDNRSQVFEFDNQEEAAPPPAPKPPPSTRVAQPRPVAAPPEGAAPPATAQSPAQYGGLNLSENCRKVLDHAAQVHRAPTKAILEKVIENWAAKQLQSWAQARSAAAAPAPPPGNAPAAAAPARPAPAAAPSSGPVEFQIQTDAGAGKKS